MPFRSECVQAISDLVDAYRSADQARIDEARREFQASLMKTFLPRGARERFRSEPRSVEQLQLDLLRAFDELRTQKLKSWVLSGALACEGAVILWLANQLMSCLGVVQAASKMVH